MNKKKATATLEAILFAMGDSVDISRLASVIEEDVETTRKYLEEMTEKYNKGNGGIMLAW
ncbi:MAG: SMC-Scp complex subunit ScpB, partial [Lachnospiraceae bacterium]|nr:SMC-Scp complex subunit ScpB [Lachnospiraceae bacterium]